MSSSRLPGKVMKDLMGRSVFYHHVERMRQCNKVESIYLATSKNDLNKPLIEEATKYGLPYYAGADEDLLERYITILSKEKADVVVRCGCDKPLFSYEIVNHLLDEYRDEDLMYSSTPLGRGIGSEVLSLSALKRIRDHYRGPAISKYIFEYPHLFKIRGIEVDNELSRPEFRLTLDTVEDYELLNIIYKKFYKDGVPVDVKEVFKYLDDNPDLANMNRFVEDKKVNIYLTELEKKSVFSIYRIKNGNYIVKNRMGEIISSSELVENIKRLKWEA